MLNELAQRDQIDYLEKVIGSIPGSQKGDVFPLEHSFVNGVYVRQITVPKGAFLIGKIHKEEHPSFLLKGEVSVLTKDGVKRLKAPLSLITKAGEKRAGYVNEEMVWVDIFKTEETNIDKIEDECVVKLYSESDVDTLLPATSEYHIYFRELTKKVIAAERPGFWSDWTPKQQTLFVDGDWESFSRSRGYSEEEILDCKEWKYLISKDPSLLEYIRDLILAAALKNIALDTKGEILKSSKWEEL